MNWELLKDSGASGHRNPYGKIQWFDVNVNGSRNKRGAWQFGNLRKPHSKLGGFTAFWKGVLVKQVVLEGDGDELTIDKTG